MEGGLKEGLPRIVRDDSVLAGVVVAERWPGYI